MNDLNFEGCASFFERTEREARENTNVKIYGCNCRGANIINTYGCVGCKSLSENPIEVIQVPKSVIVKGKEFEYVDKHSKLGIISRELNCGFGRF